MGVIFKKGDKVQRINGGVFSNGHKFLTVSSVTSGVLFTEVWFKETKSSIPSFSLELFTKTSHYKDDNMTTIFRQGDKVQRIDGDYFSNGYKVVTVDNITSDSNGSYDKVWLKETESRLPSHALELATKNTSHYSEVIDELEYERSQLLDKAGKISQAIITLKELDSNE